MRVVSVGFLAALVLAAGAFAAEIEGVKVADKVHVAGSAADAGQRLS